MAYNCLHTCSTTGYTEVLDFIVASLQTIGWTLYDDVSTTIKVFTSTGENENYVPAYIKVYISTYVRFEGYLWWNSTTHVGTAKAYSTTTYNSIRVTDGTSITVSGDKNVIVIWTAASSASYSCIGFGFVTPLIEGHTTTSSSISSGSNVLIDVDSTVGLLPGSNIMIIGTSTEGRDRVYLETVNSDTQILVTSTPRAYAAGAKVGHYPCPFFCSGGSHAFNDTSLHYVCGYNSSSTTNALSSHKWTSDTLMFTAGNADPELTTGRYILQITGLRDNISPYPLIGYFEFVKHAPISYSGTYYNQHLYCVTQQTPWMGTPTATCASGIIDVGHAWVIDEFKDKIIVITSGPGEGRTRQVLSNTEDTLVISTLWDQSPTNGSTYELHDSVYRCIHGHTCIQEIIV